MKNAFLTPDDAAALVRSGAIAVFAGSEDALRLLPKGNWIGGTTPYFMTDAGGVVDSAMLFCTLLPEATGLRVVSLPPASLPSITAGRFAHGFTYMLMPGFTEVHRSFALNGQFYPGLFDQPVMGWVTGVLLADLGSRSPKVFDGVSGAVHDNAALAMHVELPRALAAELDIVNLFDQGDGPAIVFPASGFNATTCMVDGQSWNFAAWLEHSKVDTRLPLVADYAGAQVNVAIQAIDQEAGTVSFYGPAMRGDVYRFAKPIADYAGAYDAAAAGGARASEMLACNCVLNFLYAGLEGKTTGGFVGPVTFGEIAYVLLTQTLVRLRIDGVASEGVGMEHAEAV